MPFPPSLGNRISSSFLLVGLRILLAGIIAFFLSQAKLDWFDYYLYDLQIRLAPTEELSNNTEIVLINSETIQEMRGSPSARDLSIFLDKVYSQKPRSIIFALPTESIEGSQADKIEFAKKAASLPQVYFTTDELSMKGEEGTLKLPPPLDEAPLYSAPKTADTKIFAKDGVTRRMLVSYQDQLMLHTFLAGQINPEVKFLEKIDGSFDFAGSQQVYIRFHPSGTFPSKSFESVFFGRVPTNYKDKIVIVGSDLGKSSQEYITTPFSRDIKAMTIAEMHANMLETLIKNDSITPSPRWLNAAFIFLISILTIHVVLALTPAQGLLILVSTFIGFSGFSWVLFWAAGIWVKMAAPLLAIFLCYYFFIPYRLIIENRRSWEYQQKNKLLSQVEELKTNFISMMSHDLKTPIARIQGMTDIILRENSPLNSQQREAVDTIKQSADDLLKFINAILAYGRIESESVQLHLRPKDINKLIDDVVSKHDFLAKLKRIQLLTELEPMFPIQVDPELMKQVLSNLIENAIKYSPEDTKVLITSEEKDGKVIIQVSDQGPGIPIDDLPNIFMKFYRCKNAKTSPIKGSGLGLYLAKYFIELHNGSVSVESGIGQGSTFSVEIPNNLGANNA